MAGVEVKNSAADVEQSEALDHGQRPQDRGHHQHPRHVPADGPLRHLRPVEGDGHDRDVVEQRQHDDHHRRQRKEPVGDGGEHDEHHDVERHGDAIERVAHHALEDAARFLDAPDDGREAGGGQDQRGSRAGGIRRAGDGDADVGLLQGGRVVHAVAGHADDQAALLHRLDDRVLVLGEDPRESVGGLDACGGIQRDLPLGDVAHEQVGRRLDVDAEPELARDLAGDRHIVAGHHLDLHAVLAGAPDGFRGIGARRIGERQEAEEAPRAITLGAGDAQHAEALRGVAINLGVGRCQVGAGNSGEGEDDLGGALGDPDSLAIGARHDRLGPLGDRIEGRECRGLVGREDGDVRKAGEHRQVDRVAVLGLRGERGGEQHGLRIALRPRRDLAHGQPVLGERAGLVGTQHGHASHLLDRLEPRHDRLLAGQHLGAECHGHRQHRRHRHGHRGHQQDQHEFGEPQDIDVARELHGDQDHRQDRRDGDQKVADAHDGCLEMRRRPGTLHQGGGAAEEGLAAGGGDDGFHLALLGDRTAVDDIAGLLRDRQRLSRQRRLIDTQEPAGNQPRVGRHDVAQADPHDIARDERARFRLAPGAAPQHLGLESQRVLERGKGARGLALLEEAEGGIEQQQRQDNGEIAPIADDGRHQGRGLDHPGNRAPEESEQDGELAGLAFVEGVRPILRQARLGLGDGQPRGGIGGECGEDVDQRRLGEIGPIDAHVPLSPTDAPRRAHCRRPRDRRGSAADVGNCGP